MCYVSGDPLLYYQIQSYIYKIKERFPRGPYQFQCKGMLKGKFCPVIMIKIIK